MSRDEVLNRLRECEPILRSYGVAHVALFGSAARGEARQGSDIDLMVEIAPEARIGLFEYAALVRFLSDVFPDPVDVANAAGLKATVKDKAKHDALYAF